MYTFSPFRSSLLPRIYLLKRIYLRKLSAKSPVFSHVNSTLSGLTTIRSTGAQDMLRKQFDQHQDLHTSTYSLTVATSSAFGLALDVISISFIAVVTYSFVALDDGKNLGHDYRLYSNFVMFLRLFLLFLALF